MSELDSLLQNIFIHFNPSISITKDNNDLSVFSNDGTKDNLLFKIKDIDFEEFKQEYDIIKSNIIGDYLVIKELDNYAVTTKPFISEDIFENPEINIKNSSMDIDCGKIYTKPQRDHVNKLIFWMQELDLLSVEVKEQIKKNTESSMEYTLDQLIRDDVIMFEYIKEKSVDISMDHLLTEVESMLYDCRARLGYMDNIIFNSPPIILENKVSKMIRTIDKIDVYNSKKYHLDAYAFFVNGCKEMDHRFKFLEFYHVIEYFFYSNQIKNMKELVREVIFKEKSMQFHSDDERFYTIKRLYDALESDRNNSKELDLFQGLLIETVTFESLYDHIKDMDLNFLTKEAISLDKTKIEMSRIATNNKKKKVLEINEKDKIEKNEQDKFLISLAKRLYEMRNFIVHSTKYKTKLNEVFSPRLENKIELMDIELIKKISFILINKDIEI